MKCDLCWVEIQNESYEGFETKAFKKELDVCDTCFKSLKKLVKEIK